MSNGRLRKLLLLGRISLTSSFSLSIIIIVNISNINNNFVALLYLSLILFSERERENTVKMFLVKHPFIICSAYSGETRKRIKMVYAVRINLITYIYYALCTLGTHPFLLTLSFSSLAYIFPSKTMSVQTSQCGTMTLLDIMPFCM